MNLRTLTWVLGSALTVAAGGISATACSSSSSPATSGGKDASTSDTGSGSSSGGTGSSSGSTSSSSGSSSGGSTDAGCSNVYLHQSDGGTIFCGYNGDASVTCTTGDQCCLGGGLGPSGGYAPDECAAFGSTCTNGDNPDAGTDYSEGIPIECNQIADCVANGQTGATACCLVGAKGPDPVTGCTYNKYSDGTQVRCEGSSGGTATACLAGETQICSSNADCPTGTTCVAAKWKVYDLGFCVAGTGDAGQ